MADQKFIVIEGGEGSGKSTLAKKLVDYFEKKHISVLYTREPGGVKVAEQLRDIIMNNQLDAKTEALLFAAARIEHLNKKVLPSLKNAQMVICDRYIDSSIVYQGYSRKLGTKEIEQLNLWSTNNMLADITIYLEIDPKKALERIDKSNREKNRFDEEKFYFHEQIAKGYQELYQKRENLIQIDATQSQNEIFNEVIVQLTRLLNE